MMFKNAGSVPFDRITRLLQMITPDRKYTIDDHRRMQMDALNLRAVSEVPLFRGWTAANPEVERARGLLAQWDGTLAKDSPAAAIYTTWRSAASAQERDTARPVSERKAQHEASLARAVAQMKESQGVDWSGWRWGRMHTRPFPHPLLSAFDLPTVERPGGTGSVAADGASYREVLDVADWDRSIGTNVPGQSGQPGSPYYGNLLKLWAEDSYFPLAYSRVRVEAESAQKLVLKPR
jgi:penicillin amidase